MKKIIFLLVLFLCANSAIEAQGTTYKTAVGLLVWNGYGASFKTFITEKNAIEIKGYFDRIGTRLTGLYEFHGEVVGIDGMQWYAGPGAHLGFYNFGGKQSSTFAGIDGVVGIDYKLNSTPIDLFLDWQPTYEFGLNRGAYISWGGLGIRYTF